MTEAERISKYWTDTYTQEQFELCVRRCFRQIECYSSTMLTFEDGSSIVFWKDGKWEVKI